VSALPLAAGWPDEAAMAEAWAAGVGRRLRLADGRALHIAFPGVAGGGAGPDFRGAILDAGGDFLRGDVELHLRASGWRAHGHHLDPAYGSVVLHVVGENDGGALSTLHAARAIPILELRPTVAAAPGFIPPCALASARGGAVGEALCRLGLRRLRLKAARVRPLVDSSGAGQALYTLLLETLGGPANREPFAALARRLPLALLLERAGHAGVARPLAMTAELKGAAAALSLRRAGCRPMASPTQRLEAAGRLFARLWPEGTEGEWPPSLSPGPGLPRLLRVEGLGKGMALELAVNAVLPVALVSRAWEEAAVEAAYAGLPSPGVYGKLKALEGWLGHGPGEKPFAGARALQGGLLLHADYCTQGRCGRCPMSG
jgi:Protein of unknown function (DUF2851)